MFHCDKCNAAFEYPISLYSHKRANPNGHCIYVHGTNAGHEQNRRSVGRQENAFETAVLLSPTNNVTHPAAHTAQHLQTGQRRSREEFEAGEHEDDVDEQNLQADVDLEVWKFTTLCNNGMGLNGNDRLSLMALIRKLIQASRDHNIETTLTTIAAHDSYSKEMLARKADGWKTEKIRITKEDVSQLGDTVITADFHHKDMVTFLKEQYGNKEYQGYFALQFKEERTEGGDRCYDDVHNCELWEQIEKRVRRDHPNPIATGRPPMLAALQLYSDKTLLNMKGVNSHPIRATLLNVSYGKRIKNLVDVGYFPKVEFPVGLNDVACRRIKLHVLSKCLTVLLEELKRLSFTGIDILDPWGMQQKVFPFLFNYAADHPEVMDLTCNKDGMEPCNLCHVPKDKLLQIQRAWSIKTEKEQRALLDKYWQLNNNTEREKLCKDLSFHPVPSGLWGFAYGENSALGGSQQAFAYESMHADALGVFLYIIDFIPACLSQQSASTIRIVNERMRLMPRATDFNLPFCDSKYIPDHSRVQAKEHKNVMQILPFMLNGIDDKLTQLAILWVQLYILFHNKEKYERVTGSLLKEIDEKLLQFHQVFDATIALHMPSKGNTIKYHKKSHITDTIRRLGALKHCDSDQFEHDHKRDKAGYRGTSRRVKGNAFLRELITRNRQVAIAKAGRHIKDVQKYKTAFMTAADTSSSQLYSNGMKVQLSQLAPGAHAGDSGTLSELLKNQPELLELPSKLTLFCSHDGAAVPTHINIVKSGVLASKVPWHTSYHLQTVHACAKMWGAPWFDSVAVLPGENSQDKEWYCQLRALFRLPCGRQLALIRWYIAEPSPAVARSVVERYGCTRLKWEGASPMYDVIDVQQSIIRQVYIVPDFNKEDIFWVNIWKWDRGVPSTTQFPSANDVLQAIDEEEVFAHA